VSVPKQKHYTPEQRASAVRQAREVGNVAQVSRDLGISQSALREWAKKAKAEYEEWLGRAPEVLYKYYSLAGERNDYTKRALTHREVYLSPRRRFNDPFDCHPVVSVDGSLEEYTALFHRLAQSLPPENREAAIKEMLSEHFPPNDQERARFASRIENTLDSIGVLCLSKTATSAPMWAHYADNHRGICIGYRFMPPKIALMAGYQPYEVHYQDNRPVVRAVQESRNAAETMVSVKSSEWAYEEEWRMVNFNGYGVMRLRDQYIHEVILGADAAMSLTNEVREWVSDYRLYRPAIFRARLSDDEFRVDADLIEPGLAGC